VIEVELLPYPTANWAQMTSNSNYWLLNFS